jgi:3-dehydrotetronate 4-kinase
MKALGIVGGFDEGADLAAGVPVLRAAGGKQSDMLLALKSGNFGGAEFFGDALKLTRGCRIRNGRTSF